MLVRITEAGRPAFHPRKGEAGISVFETEAVTPPLAEGEILACFRAGSELRPVPREAVAAKGLVVAPVPGAEPLPPRLRDAHAEIRPGPGMTRPQFKQALKELE